MRKCDKTRLARNRRRDDLAEVAARLSELCSCPACQGGYERRCWAGSYLAEAAPAAPDLEALTRLRCTGPTTLGALEVLP